MAWKAYYIDKMTCVSFGEIEGELYSPKPFRVEVVDDVDAFLKEFEGDDDALLVFKSDDLIIIEYDENITTTVIILKKEY